jgi:hypothetical protein
MRRLLWSPHELGLRRRRDGTATRRLLVPAAFAAITTAAIALGAVVGAAGPASAGDDERPARRVLVFSIPFVSWGDLDTYEAPNLEGFLDDAAIAGLTTRSERRVTKLADGYLTLSAGTRSVGDPSTDGDALGVREQFGDSDAGAVYFTRSGRRVSNGIVSLALPRVAEVNRSLLYDAELGALGIALRDAGVARAVIANGDGEQPDTPPSPVTSRYKRQAALALIDARGRLPGGKVDGELLADDPDMPFSKKLDLDAVEDAFVNSWKGRTTVLVEASDLARADRYRGYASPTRREVLTGQAIHASDALFARLLEHVDLERDAVFVVGPAHATRQITLTVLGIRAPGMEAGLLRSATTRRSGFVQLVDVAPTILDVQGIDRPTSMEGRPVEVGKQGGSAADRRSLLVEADAAAQFRDLRVGEIQTAAVVFAAALALWAFLVFRRSVASRWRDWLGVASFCVLAFLPATFLLRIFPLYEWGFVPYWALLVAISGALGAAYLRISRDHYLDGLLVALLVPIVLLIIDVLIGTPLQFNSALGYSPTVAGRFTGFSNPAYALVAASTVIAAPLLAHRMGDRGRAASTAGPGGDVARDVEQWRRRGVWTGIALMGVVIVIDGAPFWGSDVGGILSMVPAFAVTAVLLLGWRVRWRTVGWCVVGLVVAIGAFTALDMARPPDRRTHLGRLVERVEDRGIGDFVVVVQRKLADNLGSLRQSVWGFILPIALALALWLVFRARHRLVALREAIPEVQIAGIGLAIVAALGWALNDSGIAIPGVMLTVAMAALVWLLVRTDPDRSPRAAGSKKAPPAKASKRSSAGARA